MKRAVLADTGPLYAAVDPNDAYHRRAQDELRRLGAGRYEVTIAYPTLLETYSLVLYRLGLMAASNWLEEVLTGSTLLNPTPDDYMDAVQRIAALPDQSITLFDGAVAVLSDRLELKIWTYDYHFDVMRCRVWR